MNPMKENLEIVDDIMNGVSQTKTWARIQRSDPKIKEAFAALDTCLNKLKGTEQENLIDELFNAALGLSCAFEYPTILYGIRVAYAFQSVAADPTSLSQHIMDRVAKHEEGKV